MEAPPPKMALPAKGQGAHVEVRVTHLSPMNLCPPHLLESPNTLQADSRVLEATLGHWCA